MGAARKSVRLKGLGEGVEVGQLCFIAGPVESTIFEFRGKGWWRPLTDEPYKPSEVKTMSEVQRKVTFTADTRPGLTQGEDYEIVGSHNGHPIVINDDGKQQRIKPGEFTEPDSARVVTPETNQVKSTTAPDPRATGGMGQVRTGIDRDGTNAGDGSNTVTQKAK